jgi:hypothetical protein
MRVNTVRFSPGVRTAWHAHAVGQTLYVTEGIGLIQSRGGEVIEIRPGIGPFICAGRATGAGGANVTTYADLRQDLAGSEAALPGLPDGIGMSLSFRRATRARDPTSRSKGPRRSTSATRPAPGRSSSPASPVPRCGSAAGSWSAPERRRLGGRRGLRGGRPQGAASSARQARTPRR